MFQETFILVPFEIAREGRTDFELEEKMWCIPFGIVESIPSTLSSLLFAFKAALEYYSMHE